MTKEDYDIEVAKEYTTLQERIEALEKENAELKTDNVEWEKASDKWKNLYHSTNNQLTKAKEIIKGLLELGSIGDGDYTYVAEAEQFLSEVEK